METSALSNPDRPEESQGPISLRSPAPGRLALVQSFLNSIDYEEGIEHFGSVEKIQDWLIARNLIRETIQLSSNDRDRVIEFREALRDIVGTNTGEELWEGATERFTEALGSDAVLIPVVSSDGHIDLVPAGDGLDATFAGLMLICQNARVDGTWRRFKLCRNPDCRWAFYDTSKNRSGVWCDMAICGSRHKARAYRLRKQSS